MGSEFALGLDYLSFAELADRPAAWWQGVLGLAAFDAPLPAPPAAHIPMVGVQTPVLGANARPYEVWRCAQQQARSGERGRVQYRHAADVVFGSLIIPESATSGGATSALQSSTEAAYREIFSVLEALRMPHLVRVWNYLPDISGETHGAERYWQFNSARQDAFIACGRTVTGGVPAACGVGSPRGAPLVIYFLASSSPPTSIENPRQISAYHYPPQYSPRSPTFSRACVANFARAPALFISGTASILGHATVHRGDAAAQTRETMSNIRALLAAANATPNAVARFALDALWYKAYVRHSSDLAAIEAELRANLGSDARVLYLHADLCRQDLLIEIEATACYGSNGNT
jgi:chorismate lyase / 3-hydroxybenzoate synthase